MDRSQKVAALSILNNVLLSLIKIGLSALSGSIALLADAIHSLTDVVSSLAVFIGLKISKRTSKAFPYGLYKVENLVSLATAFAIFFAGYEIVKEVFSGGGEPLTHLPIALAGVLMTIAMTFLFSRYELKVGKEIGSPSLIADGKHIKTDMLSSVVILLGLAGAIWGLPLDKVAAVVVVVFIGHAGWEIMVDAVRVLLDASLDFNTLNMVKDIIMHEPEVKELRGLWGRNSGAFKFIEADITVSETKLERAHQLSQALEKRIQESVPNVDHILIHYEPVRKEFLRYAFPLDDEQGVLSKHFGEAPLFEMVTVRADDHTVVHREQFKNEFLDTARGKGILVAEWLATNNVDKIFLKEMFEGRGPTYVLSDTGIEVTLTEAKSIQDVLRSLR